MGMIGMENSGIFLPLAMEVVVTVDVITVEHMVWVIGSYLR
jgi:hypothetical protein